MPRSPVRLLIASALLAAGACSVDDIIARRMDEPDAVAGAAGQGGQSTGQGGQEGTGGNAGVVARPRGRVTVVEGRLLTDRGTPLRGLTIPLDLDWTLEDFDLLERIATTTGHNALHVYAENWSQAPGTNRAAVDALVSLSAQAGLYLVLSRGGGPDAADHPGNGWFDPEQVAAFWDVYAGRYSGQTHVLYEIQNNPEISCGQSPETATIQLQRDIYERIRAAAPDTHVALYSFSSVPELSTFDAAFDGVKDLVDFHNASFFMHSGLPCLALGAWAELDDRARTLGVPLLISQLPIDDWSEAVTQAEDLGWGWFQHHWLAQDGSTSTLIEELEASGYSWCPDQGTFPEDAESCQSP